MQQTSFPYEVLVYDDASTDSTPEIIKEYTEKYPDIFKPTLYENNNFSQGLGYVGLYTGIREAKSRYVAYCEGDDYWTDPLKLQKQVIFLESHPEYEVCAHETLIRDEANNGFDGLFFSQFNKNLFISTAKKHYTFEDSLTGNIFHISSLLYRNLVMDLPPWIAEISACDLVLFMLLAEKGDMYVLPEAMSVYRGHLGSVTTSREEYQSTVSFYLLSIDVLKRMNVFWKSKYQNKIFPIISRYYVECAMVYTRHSTRSLMGFRDMMKNARQYDRHLASTYLAQEIKKKVKSRLCP